MNNRLDSAIHQVITTGELAAWIHREFPAFPLFLFRMRDSGRYGIGEWLGGAAFIEHCAVGPDPGAFNRRMADDLRWEVRTPASAHRRMALNIIKARQRKTTRQYDERNYMVRDMADHMLRNSRKESQYLRALAGRL